MYSKSIILPLTFDGDIYGLFDKDGKQIGSGSREVCQTLLYMLSLWGGEAMRPVPERAVPRVRRPPHDLVKVD